MNKTFFTVKMTDKNALILQCSIEVWCTAVLKELDTFVFQHVCGVDVKFVSDTRVSAGYLSISGFANYPFPVKLGHNERGSTYFSVKSCSSLNRQTSENKLQPLP